MMFVDIFGTINKPISTKYGSIGTPDLGLVSFVNNLLGLVTTIAGIFVIVNFIIAGYQYLSSNGEAQKILAAGNKILQSAIGIGLVAIAYVIAAIVGKILFNDPTRLLQPGIFTQ